MTTSVLQITTVNLILSAGTFQKGLDIVQVAIPVQGAVHAELRGRGLNMLFDLFNEFVGECFKFCIHLLGGSTRPAWRRCAARGRDR